jgi:hypothetical protein
MANDFMAHTQKTTLGLNEMTEIKVERQRNTREYNDDDDNKNSNARRELCYVPVIWFRVN